MSAFLHMFVTSAEDIDHNSLALSLLLIPISSGWTGGIQIYHPLLLQGGRRGAPCIRHNQEGHLQPPDHLAGGRQAAQQQQHGHHAHREQKVSQTPRPAREDGGS